MIASNPKKVQYNVSDVAFEDARDKEIPSEYQQLFDEYCAELDWLTRPGTSVQTPLWCAIEAGYTSRLLDKNKHAAYTKSLLCSGDVKKVEAAVEAMKRLVLKWDASSAIAKLNRDAYAAREQQKARERSAPKIRAWEQECRRNPYYTSEEAIEAMKQREEQKLMQRLDEYRQKWHSNSYPVQEPHMGDDGYMVIDMPKGWTRHE